MQEFFDSCKMTSYLTGFYLTNGTPTSAETGCLPGTQTYFDIFSLTYFSVNKEFSFDL